MTAVARNPDLPLSYVRPVTAVFLDFTAAAAGDDQEPIDVLLWGEGLPSGIQPFNAPSPIDSQGDADLKWGKLSVVALMARAALSTGMAGRMRLFGVGVPAAPAGTAATIQIAVSGPATAPGGGGFILGGTQTASVSWQAGDSANTVATALLAALQALDRCPFTWAINGSILTGTANIKGAVLEDYPIRCFYTRPATGILFGPGTLTIGGTTATGAGSMVLTCGAVTVSAALAGGETPTAAAALLVAALNADDLPLDPGVVTGSGTAVLPLYFAPGRDIRRTSANILTSTGLNVTLLNGTQNTGAVPTYAGVPGSGFPTLTGALANVRTSQSYGKWVCPWFDAATAGALFNQIDQDGGGGGGQQRGQVLHLCGTGGLVATGALPGATTPSMNTAPQSATRGAVALCPDAPMPGFELAARLATLRASVASPFTNYDGMPIPGTADCPVLAPARAAQMSDATINSAIRDYGLTPLTVKGGQLVIEIGRTTTLSPDRSQWDWSYIDQRDAHRSDIKTDGPSRFAGCALVAGVSQVSSEKDIDVDAVKAWLRGWIRQWAASGTYDLGANPEQLLAQVNAQIDPQDRRRCNALYPDSPKLPLHTLGVIAQNAQPSL